MNRAKSAAKKIRTKRGANFAKTLAGAWSAANVWRKTLRPAGLCGFAGKRRKSKFLLPKVFPVSAD
jgi:hypothetical protein